MIFVEMQVGKICLLFVVDAVMVLNIRKCKIFRLCRSVYRFYCSVCYRVWSVPDSIVCARYYGLF